MERRNFIQRTLSILAASGLGSSVLANGGKLPAAAKWFRVKALQTRYKDKILYGDTPIDFKLLSSDTKDSLSVFISTNNKKGFGPPLHIHYDIDEFFCVLEGRFLFQLDDEIAVLEKGDCLFIPRNTKHCFNYDGSTSGTLLVGITPGKGMEEYFSGMGKLLTKEVPNMEAMQALYKSYNSEILGPPMK